MKRNKLLDKLVKTAVTESFIKEQLNISKVEKYVKAFKKLPTPQALYALTHLMKRLKLEIDKYTLLVESAADLTRPDLEKIKGVFQKQYSITHIQSIKTASLLGGLKIKIGDNVFDYSVKERINQLKGVIQHG